MTGTTAEDNLRALLYETYFSILPRDRQHAEWVIKPQLWDEIRMLKSSDDLPFVLPMPGEVRRVLMGLPVHLDDLADWVELRPSTSTAL